jgi:hypothetical protein
VTEAVFIVHQLCHAIRQQMERFSLLFLSFLLLRSYSSNSTKSSKCAAAAAADANPDFEEPAPPRWHHKPVRRVKRNARINMVRRRRVMRLEQTVLVEWQFFGLALSSNRLRIPAILIFPDLESHSVRRRRRSEML